MYDDKHYKRKGLQRHINKPKEKIEVENIRNIFYEPIESGTPLKATNVTLGECLTNFFKSQYIGDEYYCKKWNPRGFVNTSKAVRRTLFLHLPTNLIINVRRFKYWWGEIEKDNTRIKFDAELSLDRYCLHRANFNDSDSINDLGGSPKSQYELYGVVIHHGSMAAGHYTCWVSHIIDNEKKW